eukprot:scaffold198125_cov31-Tisochrysis_lutea.AAC.7
MNVAAEVAAPRPPSRRAEAGRSRVVVLHPVGLESSDTLGYRLREAEQREAREAERRVAAERRAAEAETLLAQMGRERAASELAVREEMALCEVERQKTLAVYKETCEAASSFRIRAEQERRWMRDELATSAVQHCLLKAALAEAEESRGAASAPAPGLAAALRSRLTLREEALEESQRRLAQAELHAQRAVSHAEARMVALEEQSNIALTTCRKDLAAERARVNRLEECVVLAEMELQSARNRIRELEVELHPCHGESFDDMTDSKVGGVSITDRQVGIALECGADLPRQPTISTEWGGMSSSLQRRENRQRRV